MLHIFIYLFVIFLTFSYCFHYDTDHFLKHECSRLVDVLDCAKKRKKIIKEMI